MSLLDTTSLVVQLWCGVIMWEIVFSTFVDWAIIRGRQGCRASLVLCFLCKYLAIAAIAMTSAFLGFAHLGIVNLRLIYAMQFVQKISFSAAYVFLTCRSVSVCQKTVGSWVLGMTHLALWAVNMGSLSTYRETALLYASAVYTAHGSKPLLPDFRTSLYQWAVLVSVLVCNVLFFVCTVWGLFAHRHRAREESGDTAGVYGVLRMLLREGVHYYAIVLCAPVPVVVGYIVHSDNPGLLRCLTNDMMYLATITCASRLFSLTVARAKVCSVRTYCVLYNSYASWASDRSTAASSATSDGSSTATDVVSRVMGRLAHPPLHAGSRSRSAAAAATAAAEAEAAIELQPVPRSAASDDGGEASR